MNWVDLVILTVLLLFTFEGLGRSFFSEVFDLFGFLLAFLLSLRFNNFSAQFFEQNFDIPHSLALVLGFIAIWYVVEIFLYVLMRLTYRTNLMKFRLPGERYFSIIPALLKGIVFVTILLILVGTFPIQPKIKASVQESTIGSLLLKHTYQLETPLKNVFGGLANDTLSFLTVQPKSNESVGLGFKTEEFEFDSKLEQQMLELVNKERVANGLSALTYDTKLRDVGRDHSADMFKRGYFSHYSPEGEDVADRSEKYDIKYMVIGENLAFAPSLELAHKGLMNSPGHRANILSPDFKKIGIGAANGKEFGLMFTQVFSN